MHLSRFVDVSEYCFHICFRKEQVGAVVGARVEDAFELVQRTAVLFVYVSFETLGDPL